MNVAVRVLWVEQIKGRCLWSQLEIIMKEWTGNISIDEIFSRVFHCNFSKEAVVFSVYAFGNYFIAFLGERKNKMFGNDSSLLFMLSKVHIEVKRTMWSMQWKPLSVIRITVTSWVIIADMVLNGSVVSYDIPNESVNVTSKGRGICRPSRGSTWGPSSPPRVNLYPEIFIFLLIGISITNIRVSYNLQMRVHTKKNIVNRRYDLSSKWSLCRSKEHQIWWSRDFLSKFISTRNVFE